MTEGDAVPGVGAAVHDTARDRSGRVEEHVGPRCRVRPFSGGRTWDANPAELRPLGQDELLRILVAEANARSSRDL